MKDLQPLDKYVQNLYVAIQLNCIDTAAPRVFVNLTEDQKDAWVQGVNVCHHSHLPVPRPCTICGDSGVAHRSKNGPLEKKAPEPNTIMIVFLCFCSQMCTEWSCDNFVYFYLIKLLAQQKAARPRRKKQEMVRQADMRRYTH